MMRFNTDESYGHTLELADVKRVSIHVRHC